MQQPHESLETFYIRIREAGAMCKFKDLEEDLVKDLFISSMTNTSIQMDLLSEVKTPQQVLNFAINSERGQANQQEILKHTQAVPTGRMSHTLETTHVNNNNNNNNNAQSNNPFSQHHLQAKHNHASNADNHS